jgi:hypothetical protein
MAEFDGVAAGSISMMLTDSSIAITIAGRVRKSARFRV